MKVHINEPCQEDWGQMTPKEQGRHCAKCEKVVVDFTEMPEVDVIDHMYSNSNTCGRFNNWQLEKELVIPKLQNPWTNWVSKFAWSSFLFGTSMTAQSQSQIESVVVKDSIEAIPPLVDKTDSSRNIRGQVIQPTDSNLFCTSLRFTIDSFVMEIPIVDTTFSFQVPASTKLDSIYIELSTKSDCFIFNLSDSTTDYTNLIFAYDSIWKIEPVDSFREEKTVPTTPDHEYEILTFTTGNIIMGGFGLPIAPQVFEPFKPGKIKWIEQNPTLDIPNISGIHPPKSSDSNFQQLSKTSTLSKDLIVYKKRNSSVWWWLLPIPLLLFLAGYYAKKKKSTVLD